MAKFVAAYLTMGMFVAVMLSRLPYNDSPWWFTTVAWPLFVRVAG